MHTTDVAIRYLYLPNLHLLHSFSCAANSFRLWVRTFVSHIRKTCSCAPVKNHILQLCPNKTGHSQMVSSFDETGRKWWGSGVWWVGAASQAVCSSCKWCQNNTHLQSAAVGFDSVGQVVIHSRTRILYIRGHEKVVVERSMH